MYDPANGADAIREGMTYTPRTQEAQQYSQSVGNAASAAIKPAMPIIDTWKKGVDIAGQYSPVVGAGLRTVPAAIGIAMGAKPALQTGRQVSEGLGAMQGRMIANANAPSTLNTAGFRGQRGAIGTPKRPLTEFEQAHLLAQQRAALPVEKGGLGLPADNTAMDRARAMGFDTDAYHGTGADIDAFDMSKVGSNIVLPVNAPRGVYTAKDADIASRYSNGNGSNVIPLIQKSSDTALNNSKIMATLDPSSIRSRFAAFDPFNRDSSNLLAQSAKLAPTTALGAYMYNEKRKKSQGNQ